MFSQFRRCVCDPLSLKVVLMRQAGHFFSLNPNFLYRHFALYLQRVGTVTYVKRNTITKLLWKMHREKERERERKARWIAREKKRGSTWGR